MADEEITAIGPDVARTTASEGYALTVDGFVPKPFSRLRDEKLALARELFGDGVDLRSASPLRKLIEISALEDARTWSALAGVYDAQFISSATGGALSRLGAELGLERPFLEARGQVTLTLEGDLPAAHPALRIGRGARLLTPGGHHAALDASVTLSGDAREAVVAVSAFVPGPEHNLDPTSPGQRLDRWNVAHAALAELFAVQQGGAAVDVKITHEAPLSGGEERWPDARYRALLLRAPRAIWTREALRLAAAQVPGVRQVQVRDAWGGLDIHQSVFGTAEINFVERLFGSQGEAASPYRVSLIVAPTPAAIWEGADGLRASVMRAIDDVRPAGIFPTLQQAHLVGVGVGARVDVRGLGLPSTGADSSAPARALKARLIERLGRYVDTLDFGEPVRAAEVTAALMEEQGLVDVRNLVLLKYPPGYEPGVDSDAPEEIGAGANVALGANQVPVLVDDALRIQVQAG